MSLTRASKLFVKGHDAVTFAALSLTGIGGGHSQFVRRRKAKQASKSIVNIHDDNFHVALSAAYRRAARKGAIAPDDGGDVRRILRMLDYVDEKGCVTGAPALIDWRIRLLSVLERCRQYFDFSALGNIGDGAHLVGAVLVPTDFGLIAEETPPISAGGRAATLRDALEGCICEAAERLSIYDYARGGGTLTGHDLLTNEACAAPRTDILKPLGYASAEAPVVTSAGCGAGASFDAAVESGLLELVERDAVALWWRGGRRGGEADDLAPLMKPPFSAAHRNGVRRWRWFLDLTTDIGAPVIGAVSALADGKGVVFAAAAAWDRRAAAAKAALELAQMELAANIATAKQTTAARGIDEGAESGSPGDQLWLARLATHDAKSHSLFHPVPTRPQHGGACADRPSLIAALTHSGHRVSAFDLTLPAIGVPCVRVIAPALQQMSTGAPVTARLAAIMDDPRAAPPPDDWPPPI